MIGEPLHDPPAFVVVGGYDYSPAMNQPSTMMVRELSRRHRVLNLVSEARGSILRVGRARHLSAGEVARTVLGPTRPRRIGERLWIAPVRGLSAIGPLSAPEAMRRRNVRVLTDVVRGWMRDLGVERCVLLFYWWALPEFVDTVPNLASVYDCVDDHAATPQGLVPARLVTRLEGRLLDAVDRTYVVSPGLLERRASPGRRIDVLPNGFDVELFRSLERRGFEISPALRAIPRPIIGYTGGLTRRMDWELLEQLAARRPEWSFAFFGGHRRDLPAGLRARPNVHARGNVPYPDALSAISCFDVGTIPVRVDRFSRGNSFLKLLDYLAHGLPVVASPLPDTEPLADAHPGLLRIAAGADAWEVALSAALAEPAGSPEAAARRAYVEGRSVERRVRRITGDLRTDVTSQLGGPAPPRLR